MEQKLKPISKAGISEAISKAEVYRYLNEPGEAESICRDILAVESDNQTALRLLGLAITDQFTGETSDRYSESESVFRGLSSEYERVYHLGILRERKAKAQLRAGRLHVPAQCHRGVVGHDRPGPAEQQRPGRLPLHPRR